MVLGYGLNGYLNNLKKRGFGALGAVDDHKISAAPSVVSGLMPTSQIPFTEPVMPLAFRLRSAEATSGVDMETYPKIHVGHLQFLVAQTKTQRVSLLREQMDVKTSYKTSSNIKNCDRGKWHSMLCNFQKRPMSRLCFQHMHRYATTKWEPQILISA